MNFKMILKTTGKVVEIESVLMLLPTIVSLCYGEYGAMLSFIYSALICAFVGLFMAVVFKPKTDVIFAKEGVVTVAFSWILVSVFGALPFCLSGEIPDYVDALFETVSGFTTTGASILNDVTVLSHGMLFWRSFTHFVGGMGVLVFLTAITNSPSDRSIHILRAEMPGPIVDKIVPRAKKTAIILYLIYLGMTALLAIMLLCGGVSFFESLVYAFGTAGTGGFGVRVDSIASYSLYVKWVLAIFMLLFGVNFNLYYLVLLGKFTSVFKNLEFRVYVGIIISSVVLVAIGLRDVYSDFGELLTQSTFQVSAFLTTTGYGTADVNSWPLLSKSVLLILMFLGGGAGSTAGGFKLSRLIIVFLRAVKNMKKVIH
ncbi:MAG: TrkH family potassium uptake protein, partial [Clostridia bacterium]|nr:TrkH family potassium uptake protein [Clostridia bacterium]